MQTMRASLINKKNKLLILILFLFNACVDNEKNIFNSYNKPLIVFSGYKWWNYDIISVDINGNDYSHITRNQWADTEPIVSRDGSQLIFASDRDGNREIYSMDVAYVGGYYNWVGENLQNLSRDKYFDGDFSFSPNGEKILYLKYFPSNDNYDIFLMNSDGSNKKNISNSPWYEKKPMFSPDGTNIIYQSWQYSNVEIFFTHLMEGNQVNISKSPGDDIIHWGMPFSPDGQQIIFSSNRDGNSEIYIMNKDGSNQKNLTQHKSRDWSPRFYPGDDKIVFMSDRDGNWEIYAMNRDGTQQTNLSNNPRTDFSFSFLPLPE